MSYAIADDGIEIYYEKKGHGQPVIFVSGYFGIHDIWNAQIEDMSQQYCTVAYDSRGYGRSAKPSEADSYSILQHAEDLKAVIDSAGISEPLVLVSHSMGCNIISAFAIKYPERVAGLVYTACFVDGKQLRDAGMTVEVVKNRVATPSGAEAFYRPFGVPENLGSEAAKWPAHSMQANAAAFLNCEMADQLSAITTPALILQGENDVPNPPSFAVALQQALGGGAELKLLKGVNHFPALEAPETVTAFVKEYVKASMGRANLSAPQPA